MTAAQAADLFTATYGYTPQVVASAPGRVNLIGEHTDYSGGEVLPIAISRRTWVAMAPGQGASSRAASATMSKHGQFALRATAPSGHWWDYVHGTLRELVALGVPLSAVDVAVVSDVPTAAGLSSSAALEVATALAGVVCARGRLLETWDHLALAAHRAETDFVGVGCGTMDQTASAYASEGHALRIWCDTGRRAQVPFERSVLVIDTVTPRSLRASAYNERKASCERALLAVQRVDPGITHLAHASLDQLAAATLGDEDRRRARHVIAETARVGAMVEALEGDGPLGALLSASHASLRDDFACSTPELDWVVDFATKQPHIDGARMTGAGWGGCAIALGTADALRALAESIGPAFTATWGRAPRTWLTRAEEGGDVDLADGLLVVDS